MAVNRGNMSDWLTGADPASTPARSTATESVRAPVAAERPRDGLVWSVVVLEGLLLLLGVWTLGAAVRWRFVGYLACGIALPLVWALLYVNLKRRDLVDDARTIWLERINRWLLVGGLVVGIWCAVLVALEWAK